MGPDLPRLLGGCCRFCRLHGLDFPLFCLHDYVLPMVGWGCTFSFALGSLPAWASPGSSFESILLSISFAKSSKVLSILGALSSPVLEASPWKYEWEKWRPWWPKRRPPPLCSSRCVLASSSVKRVSWSEILHSSLLVLQVPCVHSVFSSTLLTEAANLEGLSPVEGFWMVGVASCCPRLSGYSEVLPTHNLRTHRCACHNYLAQGYS